MNILLITGGDSSERKISLISAKNVKEALEKNGHKVLVYDLKNGYEKIKTIALDVDVLFPVLHGEEGEGGKLHKYLVKLRKPIVGSANYKGFQKAWFKIPFKRYCAKNNILTAKWRVIKKKEDILRFGFPCVVKGSSGGSSREVFICKSKADLENISISFKKDLKKGIKTNAMFFVEEYISGIELTVGVLDNKALPVIKIVPPSGEWFSYDNKYTSRTQEIVNPKDISISIKKKLQRIGLSIHKNFNLGSYSRIDFILDKTNRLYVLEVNTIPGLTKESLLPKMAKGIGLSFEEFIERLVKLAK